jgi:ABC-type multidrug transport system permease subunit
MAFVIAATYFIAAFLTLHRKALVSGIMVLASPMAGVSSLALPPVTIPL